MKKFIFLTIAFLAFAISGFGQDYTLNLKKTMSPNPVSSDYAFWSFPLGTMSTITLDKGDTVDVNVTVDLNKDFPVLPSLQFQFQNVTKTTDSLYVSGTIYGSQFSLLTADAGATVTLTTIGSTKLVPAAADPYYYMIADSTNSLGFAISKKLTKPPGLRSLKYQLRFIPRGTTDQVKLKFVRFKAWGPEY